MYLFDTDSITNIFKKDPSKKFIERLKELNYSDQYISTITVSEIVYGALKSIHPEHHLKNLETLILSTVQVLSFDTRAAYEYGKIRQNLESTGQIISHTDMQIASISIVHDLTLITGNIKHFARIKNLKVENWL